MQHGYTALMMADRWLMMAARYGHSDVCAKLLKANASPDLKDMVSALEMAQQRLMWALC